MNRRLWITVLLSGLLGACAVVPMSPYDYDAPEVYASPPPHVEYPGYPPQVGYVWIGGYWSLVGHRHEWVPGRWSAPRPGHQWIAPRWERDGRDWRQHQGYWAPQGHPRALPPAPVRHDRERPPPRRSESLFGDAARQEHAGQPQEVRPPRGMPPPRRGESLFGDAARQEHAGQPQEARPPRGMPPSGGERRPVERRQEWDRNDGDHFGRDDRQAPAGRQSWGERRRSDGDERRDAQRDGRRGPPDGDRR